MAQPKGEPPGTVNVRTGNRSLYVCDTYSPSDAAGIVKAAAKAAKSRDQKTNRLRAAQQNMGL